MKKLFVFAFLVVAAFGVAYGAGESLNKNKAAYRPQFDGGPGRVGYLVTASDTAITSSYALVTRYGWIHPASADTIRIYGKAAADSSYVTMWGILAKHGTSRDSVKTSETLRLSGTDTVYSGKRWNSLEFAAVDTFCRGVTFVARGMTNSITEIPAGKYQTETAHFWGRPGPGSGFLGWTAQVGQIKGSTSRDTVEVQLRMYVRADTGNFSAKTDVRNLPEVGSILLDHCTLVPNSSGAPYQYYPKYPVFVPSGSYVAVFSKGSATTGEVVDTKLEFYDK